MDAPTDELSEEIQKIEQQGFVISTRYNKDRSVCAINCRPGTEINNVHLAMQLPSGKIKVMEGVSDAISKAIIDINPKLPSDYVEVDRVEDRTLLMSCGTKGEHHYDFKVQITSNGGLHVLPKSFRKID